MILFGVPIVIALYFWARWLSRKYSAPRWMRFVGWSIVALWAVPNLFSVWGIYFASVRSVDGMDAASKSRLLGESISEAMHAAVFGTASLIVGALVLLIFTWRYHWSVKPQAIPNDPPYR